MTDAPKSEWPDTGITDLPKSEWPAIRALARIAWNRLLLQDLERAHQQMEELHLKQDITAEYFQKICDFEHRQSYWYFKAFAGPCPTRAVFDAYMEKVLTDNDFATASGEVLAARERYLDRLDPKSMSRMNVPLLESLDQKRRSLYVD